MTRPPPLQDTLIFMPPRKLVEGVCQEVIESTRKKCYKIALTGLEPIKSSEREGNILIVNDTQNTLLKKQNVNINAGDHEFHRKLVTYFRPTQIEYVSKMQVLEIMRFLRYYVEMGYSSLFDDFVVLYRFPEHDMLEEFSRNSSDATGEDFRNLSSIYANTIHFSNGTPDFVPGTLPVLGTTPHERWKGKHEYIHLPLKYKTVEKIGHKHGIASDLERRNVGIESNSRNLIPVLKIVLEAIQKTEKAMLNLKI